MHYFIIFAVENGKNSGIIIKKIYLYGDKMKIILASASPRRKELINLITNNVTCIPADVDETLPDGIEASEAAEFLACRKALFVAASHKDEIVLGCDTVVIINGEILGKPKDREDAKRMLKLLSDNTHEVITGCCIVFKGKTFSFSCSSLVSFWPLDDKTIENYVNSGECDDKAGAYGIQEKGALLVKEIKGDYFNIVGLPVSLINKHLKSII